MCLSKFRTPSPPDKGYRTPTPIVNSDGMIYLHLAGRPSSQDYTRATQNAYSAMDQVANRLNFQVPEKHSRRGKFVARDVGVSSGTGNVVCSNQGKIKGLRGSPCLQRPHMLKVAKSEAPSMQQLRENKDICRISGYVNSEPSPPSHFPRSLEVYPFGRCIQRVCPKPAQLLQRAVGRYNE